MGGAKIPQEVPISLGNLAWGCQILGGARFPMTPVFNRAGMAKVDGPSTVKLAWLS